MMPEATIFDKMSYEERHAYCVQVVSDWIWNTKDLLDEFRDIYTESIRLPLVEMGPSRRWHKRLLSLITKAMEQLEQVDVHLYYRNNPELLWRGVMDILGDNS